MPAEIPEARLPNGMKVFYRNKDELEFLYEEMPLYFKNGIKLSEEDTVFDVGANIGMFTLMASQLCHDKITIYAFEPIPEIFQILQRNAERLTLTPEKIKLFPYGLSHMPKTTTFSYYPNCCGWSTMYPDDSIEQRRLMRDVALDNLNHAPSFIRWLRWLPRFIRPILLDKKIDKAFRVLPVSCELRTISQIMRENGIQKIDLLKIDVERSEFDVILGIEEADWPKIKQVVVEVHDLDNRIDNVTALLKQQGFNKVIVEQQKFMSGYEIFNVYALRAE